MMHIIRFLRRIADAALACWKQKETKEFLLYYKDFLLELESIEPDQSPQAAHCHAIARHGLLWCKQEVTGEPIIQEDGEPAKIYPGIFSNPEPHAKMVELPAMPLELAWYLLACVENYTPNEPLITSKLLEFLPNGELIEGHILLGFTKVFNAIRRHDIKYFNDSLQDLLRVFSHLKSNTKDSVEPSVSNVTFGKISDMILWADPHIIDVFEKRILSFCLFLIVSGKTEKIEELILTLKNETAFNFRDAFYSALVTGKPGADYNSAVASEIAKLADADLESWMPADVFQLTLRMLQLSSERELRKFIDPVTLDWLETRWAYIIENQKFALGHWYLYGDKVNDNIASKNELTRVTLKHILLAFLPMIKLSNDDEVEQVIVSISDGD